MHGAAPWLTTTRYVARVHPIDPVGRSLPDGGTRPDDVRHRRRRGVARGHPIPGAPCRRRRGAMAADADAAVAGCLRREAQRWCSRGVDARVQCDTRGRLAMRVLDDRDGALPDAVFDAYAAAPGRVSLAASSGARRPRRAPPTIPPVLKYVLGEHPGSIRRRRRLPLVPGRPFRADGTHIVYVVTACPRIAENAGLWLAMWTARRLTLPLLVMAFVAGAESPNGLRAAFAARPTQAWASAVRDLRDQLHRLGIPMLVWRRPPGVVDVDLLDAWIRIERTHMLICDATAPTSMQALTQRVKERHRSLCLLFVDSDVVADDGDDVGGDIDAMRYELEPVPNPSPDVQAPLFASADDGGLAIHVPQQIIRQFGKPDCSPASPGDPSAPTMSSSHAAFVAALANLKQDVSKDDDDGLQAPSDAFLALLAHIDLGTISLYRVLDRVRELCPECTPFFVDLARQRCRARSAAFAQQGSRPAAMPACGSSPKSTIVCLSQLMRGIPTQDRAFDRLHSQLRKTGVLSPAQRRMWLLRLGSHCRDDDVLDWAVKVLESQAIAAHHGSLPWLLCHDMEAIGARETVRPQ